MKKKEQVVNLKLAQEMKNVGAPQNSYFYYVYFVLNDSFSILAKNDFYEPVVKYAAYTVAELGEMLPRGHWESGAVALDTLFFCSWEEDWERPNEETSIVKYGKTEADARAEMWLYLKKEKRV